MGIILQFRKRRAHCRASISSASKAGGRAAKTVIISAETLAFRALSLARTADHHSAGIVSLCHHFETAQAVAEISAAIASREGHRSMMERNEVSSVMDGVIGQLVLERKAILSQDRTIFAGQNPRMSRTDYKRAFIARTKAAREAAGLTQVQVAQDLQIAQDRYKQYETRSYLPHDLIPGFCLACGVDPMWLFTGRLPRPATTRRSHAA